MKNIKFESSILKKGEDERGKFIVLSRTEFYPDGKGGQIGDRGKIGDADVFYVKEEGGTILHYVDNFPASSSVLCEIDGERRAEISALHTAQHILSAVLLDSLNIETVAFHMGEESCTIDVENSKALTEKINEVEEKVNEIVFSDIPVKKYFVSKEELEQLNIRKKHEVSGRIRVVEIPGVDISLCGGTHVESTGQIGLVKIVKMEKVKKQFIRIYFTARMRSLREFQKDFTILNYLSSKLTAGVEELPDKIEKMLGQIKSLNKENKALKISIVKGIFTELINSNGKFVIREVNFNKPEFMNLIAMLSREDTEKMFLLFHAEKRLLAVAKGKQCNLDFTELFKDIFTEFNGKGIVKSGFLLAEFSSKKDFDDAKTYISGKISN